MLCILLMYINVVKTAFAFPQQWGLNEINKLKKQKYCTNTHTTGKHILERCMRMTISRNLIAGCQRNNQMGIFSRLIVFIYLFIYLFIFLQSPQR